MKKNLLPSFLIFLIFFSIFAPSANAVTGFKKVYLDPTGDSQVNIEDNNTNYGSQHFLSTQTAHLTSGAWGTGIDRTLYPQINTLIKFNLSSIPAGSYLKSAVLKLYAYHVNTDAPCELHIGKLNSDWDERWVTWQNQPSQTLMNEYVYTIRGVGFLKSTGEEAWGITNLVNKWLSGEYRNYGISIKNVNDKADSLCKFYSKEENVSDHQDKKPQLILNYLPPLVVNNITVSQITATSATVNWISTIPTFGVFYYQDGYTGQWKGKPSSSNSLLTNHQVTLTGLSANTRYFYKIFGRDEVNREKTTIQNSFLTANSPTLVLRRITPLTSRTITGIILRGIIPSPTPTPTPQTPDPGQVDDQNQQNEVKIMNLSYTIGATDGNFTWKTKEEDGSGIGADVKTSGFVYVSRDSEPTKTDHEIDFGRNQGEVTHNVPLRYLSPDTTYNYLVYSEADDGSSGQIHGSFTTATTAGPGGSGSASPAPGDSRPTDEVTGSGTVTPRVDLTNGPFNISPTLSPGEVAGQENPIRKLISNLTNSSPGKTNFLPLIILTALIITLIVLLITRKKPSLPKPEIKTEIKAAENKKNDTTNKKGRISFKLIIILIVGFFVLSTLWSMLSFFGPIGILPFYIADQISHKINISFPKLNLPGKKTSENYKEAQTSQSFAKIDSLEKDKMNFTAVPENEWPKDTVGGLYKIEPSGNFNKIASVTIDIKDNATKGFALGYWRSDTQKWEYIPTIRIFGNTYKSLIAHASEVGGRVFGLSGALDYEPQFDNRELQGLWDTLKADLKILAHEQELGYDTSIKERLAQDKLRVIANWILNNCATRKSFKNQMDFFFIWHIAQLINATEVDNSLGEGYTRCIDMQATRADSKYEYSIYDRKDLKNDLNVPQAMQFIWKGVTTHEGYPIVAGRDNRDWHTQWQVYARTEYKADIKYHWSMNFDLPTPEGTFGNGIVTHVLLFDLNGVREGQTFKIRGVSIGDAPGYYRNWHEDLKWNINHPSTVGMPTQTDPNKHVLDMTGTLVKDNGKDGAIISYGGLTKEQQSQLNQISAIMQGTGMENIPAYFQELAPPTQLNIVKYKEYNE